MHNQLRSFVSLTLLLSVFSVSVSDTVFAASRRVEVPKNGIRVKKNVRTDRVRFIYCHDLSSADTCELLGEGWYGLSEIARIEDLARYHTVRAAVKSVMNFAEGWVEWRLAGTGIEKIVEGETYLKQAVENEELVRATQSALRQALTLTTLETDLVHDRSKGELFIQEEAFALDQALRQVRPAMLIKSKRFD